MRIRGIGCGVGACAVVLSSCGTAVGSIQTVTVGGPVTTLLDPNALTGGASSWSAQVSIDTSAPDLEPGDSQTGRYAISLVLTIGTLTESLTGEMLIVNDGGGNDYLQFGVDTGPPAGWNQLDFQANLIDYTGTAFSSDAIPSPMPTLAAFGGPGHQALSIGVLDDAATAFQLVGTVDALTPTPGGAAVLGLAGVTLLGRRRRGG